MIPALVSCFAALVLYLWHTNRAISTRPEEASKVTQKLWTSQQIKKAYDKVKSSPVNIEPYLFSKTGRRYIVVGGSGKSDQI